MACGKKGLPQHCFSITHQECAERLAKFAESGPVDISDFLLPLFLNLLVKESRLSLDQSRLV